MTETKDFSERMLEVQREIGAVTKSKDNPFYKSKYADINAYLGEVKPVLNKYGMILLQPILISEGRNILRTVIQDSVSKDLLASELYIPENPDIQKFGAGLTYLRRFAIQSLLGLEAEDDDGNVASGKQAKKLTNNEDPF